MEFQKNKEYVAIVIARDEADKEEERNKQQKKLEKMRELQRFQKIQMGEIPLQTIVSPTNR